MTTKWEVDPTGRVISSNDVSLKVTGDFDDEQRKAYSDALAEQLNVVQKFRQIIFNAYQVCGAHDADSRILDVLCDPDAATDEMVENMLPYTVPTPDEMTAAALNAWYESKQE